MRRLLGDVERLRRGELHLRGQFVAADARVEPLVAGPRGGVLAVELASRSMPAASLGAA